MASTVACVVGWGVSDGVTTDATAARHSSVSAFDVMGGSTPLASRGGIISTGGNPLKVAALPTPAMKVRVNAGRVVVPGNSTATPPFGLTLTANTDLDVDASHATLGRIDRVVARVVNDGTSASYGEIYVLKGTAASVPVAPTLPTGTSHCIALSTIFVGAAVTVIAANIVIALTTDAGLTVAPGGTVSVPTLATATGLPPGTPFYNQYDGLPGVVAPNGVPELTTPALLRYFVGTPTTNINGDISMTLLSRINGTNTSRAFPNGVITAMAVDATPTASLNSPISYKYLSAYSSASVVTFRPYDHTGAGFGAGVSVAVSGIALGY